MFKLHTPFQPCGDQPKAIQELVEGLESGKKSQVLLGITGSGKTFTIANVVNKIQKPTLVLAHNKTLAAQLYQEFKGFFPENAVEYFVSYYDYYQPEAYIPRTDTYIEKDMAINDEIDKMRLSATRSLLSRDDVLIVASVSCIYGLGLPEHYGQMLLTFRVGETKRRDEVLMHLIEMHYERSDMELRRGSFRLRGEVLEILPAYEDDRAFRIEFFDEEVERISEIDPLTAKVISRHESVTIYPGSHYVTPESIRGDAILSIKAELAERIAFYEAQNMLLEKERISQRTTYDLEMIKEVGFCKGIENYSRHFSKRLPGEAPACLIDYFPKDFLFVIDESHQTIPQLHAMYHGDRSRKKTLIDFGFRLPSAYDNRPLQFNETYAHIHQVIYVSATPGKWEMEEAEGKVIEQIIRPTGLLDPLIDVKPALHQVDSVLEEIRKEIEKGGRVLVTTLTKKLAEDVTKFLHELGIKAQYLHSDIDTLERVQIIRDLRLKKFDVLVGINLLREGLDIPEVSLVAILDADKQGFLRSETSLIQTCGRAARNAEGRVIMYADKMTDAIMHTLEITERRRAIQMEYNKTHGITPRTIIRELGEEMGLAKEFLESKEKEPVETPHEKHHEHLAPEDISLKIKEYEKLMKKAAKELNFEEAARYRDLLHRYQQMELL